MSDLIDRKAVIDALDKEYRCTDQSDDWDGLKTAMLIIENLPSAQPERLTDDDFETIRIHLNAYKEKLCNQQRWEEAEEYQRIIDRFMSFASAQPEDCDTCKHGYFGDGKCDNCRVRFPSHYERRADEGN